MSIARNLFEGSARLPGQLPHLPCIEAACVRTGVEAPMQRSAFVHNQGSHASVRFGTSSIIWPEEAPACLEKQPRVSVRFETTPCHGCVFVR